MPTRRILNLLRLTFLAVCLAAIGARVAWTQFPEQVERVDKWIIKASEHRARRELSRARSAKEAGQLEKSLDHLRTFAEMTSGVKHGDRLEGIRQLGLSSLRDEAIARGDLSQALAWAEELHLLYDRNMANELARAKLLAKLERYDEALPQFARLSYLGQGRAEYDLPYFHALLAADRSVEALKLLLRMNEGSGLELPTEGWEVRHRVPEAPWSEALFMNLAAAGGEGQLRGEVAAAVPTGIPSGEMSELRLDLPRGASVVGTGVEFTLRLEGGGTVVLDAAAMQRLNQLEAVEGGFRATSQPDPYVVLTLPELPADAVVSGYGLSLKLVPVLPGKVRDFLFREGGAHALGQIEAEIKAGTGSFTDSELARLASLKEIIRG